VTWVCPCQRTFASEGQFHSRDLGLKTVVVLANATFCRPAAQSADIESGSQASKRLVLGAVASWHHYGL
jgi:hypothetical protein